MATSSPFMKFKVRWVSPFMPLLPHRVTHYDKVAFLVKEFESRRGWDRNCPALVGYFDMGLQAITGTHRIAAARIANIQIPIVIWPRPTIELAWGTGGWEVIMRSGDHQIEYGG